MEIFLQFNYYNIQIRRAFILELLRQLSNLRQSNDENLLNVQQYSNCENGIIKNNITVEEKLTNNMKLEDYIERFSRFIRVVSEKEEMNSNIDSNNINSIITLSYQINVTISIYKLEMDNEPMAIWQNNQLRKINETISPTKRFFRIGTSEVSFSYPFP